MPTTPDSIPIADLAGALLNGPLTMARVRLALHVAVQRGYGAALKDEIARLESKLANDRPCEAPAVEFPIPDRDSDHHVRVITGTGNASERRELDALCRALGTQP